MWATIAGALLAGAPINTDRSVEGSWGIIDTTDNNTGERSVYAMRVAAPEEQRDLVILRLRCSAGKPSLFVEWFDLVVPEKTVFSIGPIVTAHGINPAPKSFMFEKVKDEEHLGLRADPEASAAIVGSIGAADYAAVTANLTAGNKTVEVEVSGMKAAWLRVSRHCPVRTYPLPTP